MTGSRTPRLVAGAGAAFGDPELLRAAACLVAAAVEQHWYDARWDHDTRELVVMEILNGPSRCERRLRLSATGRLDRLCEGTRWRPVEVTAVLQALAASLGDVDLVLLTPRMGPANRYRVDADVSNGQDGPATALFECLSVGEGRT